MPAKRPAWFDEHTRSAKADEWTTQWIRSGTPEQQKMLMRFPPSCVVEATTKLAIPSPGRLGIVVNVSDEFVYVIDGPHGDTKAECRPEWLKVVGYWKGWTPKRVAGILKSILG